MSRSTQWILLACLIHLVSIDSHGALAGDPLTWKFVPNETFNYRLTQQVKMSMDLAGGGNLQSVVNQTLDLSWKVEKVTDDGSGTILMQIKRIKLNVDGPGGQGLQYDSSAESRPQGYAALLDPLLKILTTETYRLILSPRGKIKRVEIPETLLDAIGNTPGSELMGSLASQEGLQGMLQSCLLVLPENGPLQPGDEWTVSTETTNPVLGGKPSRTSTYRYVGPQTEGDQTLEKISRQTVTDFVADAAPGDTTIQIIGQQASGEAFFARSEGRLESSTDQQTMTLRFVTGKQTVEQTLEQTVQCQWIAKEK
jgi:hypothetical protein